MAILLAEVAGDNGSPVVPGQVRDVAPRELVFRFDNAVDPNTLFGIKVTRSGDGTFGNGNDINVDPQRSLTGAFPNGFVGIGDRPSEVVMRFGEVLPDDSYRITIMGSGPNAVRDTGGAAFNGGVDSVIDFRLALGAQVVAVVPQPITRDAGGTLSQARNTIEVYFNNDDLDSTSAQTANFYHLIFTNTTATNTDDVVFLPSSVSYDPFLDKATLTFSADLDQLGAGVGTYRLRIGSGDALASAAATEIPVNVNVALNAGSSFASAQNLTPVGALDRRGLIVSGEISAQNYGLTLPGSDEEPGHREISAESHLRGIADTTDGITTIYYDFRRDFGVDPQGNPLINVIQDNPAQVQRAREVLEFYSHFLGVQFVETAPAPGTPSIGFTIGTGELRVVSPTVGSGSGDGITGIAGLPNIPVINGVPVPVHSIALAVMDSSESALWGASEFGGNYFREAMREIGQLLGYGLSTDQPNLTLNRGNLQFLAPGGGNISEPVFPGDVDIVHGQFLYRPESNDIDLYRFDVAATGTFRAETFAERLATSSLLDTVITLFGDVREIVLPATGGAGLTDGQTFTLSDGVHTVTFEFDDLNQLGAATGNRSIVYSVGDSAETIARTLAEAIDDIPSLNISPAARFNRIQLRGATNADIASAPSISLEVVREVIASNDDYRSEDSFLEVQLSAGTYYIGVSARGNSEYDPTIADSGFGGTTQGLYQLRVDFTPAPTQTLVDLSGTPLDGDVDGVPGGDFNFWFQVGNDANSIYVDKSFTGAQLGTLANPFNNLQAAFTAANNRVGNEIVRVVGNAGADGSIATLADNLAYAVGFNTNGLPLGDGTTLVVPRDVTMMVDAGAIFKMRLANVDVGSLAQNIDRSQGHLQVLGIPGQPVHFTSALDETIGNDVTPIPSVPAGSNWGGIVFRNNLDYAEGRTVLEREGIFLNIVNQADIRYGGGDVVVNSISQRFSPIHLTESRPTISYNTITRSADAAMSADPKSFIDTRFIGADFTADYERLGPHIRRNTLAVRLPNGSVAQNSVNGLFVRVRTQVVGGQLNVLDLVEGDARMDDIDITHILAENLLIRGTPEGNALTGSQVVITSGFVASEAIGGNPTNDTIATAVQTTLPVVAAGEYRVFRDKGTIGDNPSLTGSPAADRDVDFFRFDLAAGSRATMNVNVLRDPLGRIPSLDANLRLFNSSGVELAFSEANPSGTEGFLGESVDPYLEFVATTSGTYYVAVAGSANRAYNPLVAGSGVASGAFSTGQYDVSISVSASRANLDSRLQIDPGLIIKAAGSRIEAQIGAQLIAEGEEERPIVFTSLRDDRYGAGGTFDTNADQTNTFTSPGDWGGIFLGHLSQGSLDHVLVTFAGGLTRIEGTSDRFNALEIHQAEARVTNSIFERNAVGQATTLRNGRAENAATTIFVRGAQPVLVDNIIRNNVGSAISVNANALQFQPKADFGRSAGLALSFDELEGNQGPLVHGNLLGGNGLNAMEVRGATLTTQTVWDDTDIVHVLRGEIAVTNHHVYSGLRLQSSPTESLVVKLAGANAGFTATGQPLDISDRIGGTVQIAGAPGFPVVLSGLGDDTVGAGLDFNGNPMLDTNPSQPHDSSGGQWRSVQLREYSNDRNAETTYERESAQTNADDVNGTPATAQFLGHLAPNEKAGDENRRLAFELRGTIAFDSPGDVDVYSFLAEPGTEIWIDIDRTTHALDTVVELVDADGDVIARSDDSGAELLSGVFPSLLVGQNIARPLQRDVFDGQDVYTTNPRDAGMRVVLPSASFETQTYFMRVYSKNSVEVGNPTPPPYELGSGDTSGHYQVQIRLQEVDEVPGSTVRFSDIRFATNGIEILGLPAHSPLVGDSVERPGDIDNEGLAGALNVGNLLQSDLGSLSLAGSLATATDVDWYEFTLDYDATQPDNGLRTISTIFDIDYADGIARPDTIISVFNAQGQLILVSRDSDVADDQPGLTPETGPADLSRGSFGKLDAYIGPQQLPAGFLPVPGLAVAAQSRTYFVAVSSNGTLPAVLNMTFAQTAANETIKLEPVSSIQRITEDHIGYSGYRAGVQTAAVDAFGRPVTSTQIDPTTSLFDIRTPISLQANVKPFTLEDVPLFVSQNLNDGFNLFTVNAGTGEIETTYQQDFNDFGFLDPVEDIDFRSDGRLFGYASGLTAGNFQNNAGRVFEVNLANGQPTVLGNDTIPDNVFPTSQVDALAVIKTRYVFGGAPRYENIFLSVREEFGFTPQSHLAIANEQANANIPMQGFTVIGPIFETSPGDIGITTGLQSRIDIDPINDFAFENLYGVTDQGHFILIQPFFFGTGGGLATVLATFPGMQFAGLTAGPQNMDFNQDGVFGDLADTFFAMTIDGTMVAIEVTATDFFGVPTARQVNVFDVNRDGVLEPTLQTEAALIGPVTGLAFAPVDFNLWHPTERRRNNPGHGTNAAFDNSRDPSIATRITGSEKKDGQVDDVRENFESQGGLSFYFGLEDWVRDPQLARTYLQYTYDIEDPIIEGIPVLPGGPTYTPAQYGILDTFVQNDLTATSGGNNYNLPGGAKGTLLTNAFSLEGYAATDKPTLYFNYYLNTENQSNDPAQGRLTNGMRDSARVFVSADGGDTWSMVATNNAYRDINVPRGELPAFASASSNVDSTGTRDPRQRVQELFDTIDGSNEWRQARIDLGEFAGQKNLQLRFDFSTAGAMKVNLAGDNSPDLPGDEFGNTLSEERFQNNNFEGFYVDDILIGFAERGEVVTNSQANSAFVTVPSNPNPAAPQETLNGAYQLEIRAATEYGANIVKNGSPIIVGPTFSNPAGQIFDTNDRMVDALTIIAPSGTGVIDRQTFQINDGQTVVTFEFESGGGVTIGNVPILFTAADSAAKLAGAIRDAINAAPFEVSAISIATSDKVELSGAARVIVSEAPKNLTVSIPAASMLEGSAPTTATVTRSGSLVGNLVVTLSSSDTSEATVPVTVTILNGQASANFNIAAVNDGVADGTQTVTIGASASGFNRITDSIDVTDLQTAALIVTIAAPTAFSENAGLGITTGTVTRNSPTNVDLLVSLLSTDPSEARVAATVLIPAGQPSATFSINATNDPWIDGTQSATIVAYATGFASGSATVIVTDDGVDTVVQTFGATGAATPWQTGPAPTPFANALKNAFAYVGAQFSSASFGAADLTSYVVTNQYVSSHTGVTHVYLRQKLNGLEVLGTEININIAPDGGVLNQGGSPIGTQAFVGMGIAPDLSAEDAVRAAAAELIDSGLASADVEVVESDGGITGSMVLFAPDISADPIPVELKYLRVSGGVELVWNMVLRTPDGDHWYDVGVNASSGQVPFVSDWVAHASYEALNFNLENPDDGPRSSQFDPHLAAPNASPFGWHDTNAVAGPEFTDTRGNNVFAQEDLDGNNTGGFRPAGGPGLNFDYPLDLTQDPLAYTSASIVNLFYLSNISHDIHYQYGFDEVSGNFQFNNYGNGGLGGDAVQADAQDGSGFNNANFATPPDGFAPRMQQFLFTVDIITGTPLPLRLDSSLENTIVTHEYGHGVSTRLTGGPANSNSLNALQSAGMGEGWSDWWSLMFSQKPTDTQLGSYPIGNYVRDQPPTGAGIRRFPYSFDMTIDPLTYGDFNGGFPNNEVHNSGELWASALWDMNWLLINKYGFNADLYNGTGGNNLALQLVMDGLKLQPALPTFLDARDGILLADQILTGGVNQPEIWAAFARRGMGLSAFDGGSANATTVAEAFDVPVFGTGQTITAVLSAASISENGGIANGVVTRSGPNTTDLFVTLATSDVAQAIVAPTVVLIPAGQSSATFQVFGVDDLVADGTHTVIVTPVAVAFDSVTDTLDILDNETPALTLAIDASSIREDAGPQATFGTVTRNTPIDTDLVVNLSSHDTSEAVITSVAPADVKPAVLLSFNDDRGTLTNVGTPSASALAGFVNADGVIRLVVTGFNDFNFNGTHNQAGSYDLFVRVGSAIFPVPFDPTNFTFRRQDALQPGSFDTFSFAGLTPNTPFLAWTNNNVGAGTPDTILASYASFFSSRPEVISAVLIPAGQTSATFPIGTPNEFLGDGTQTVAILASAPGLASALDTVNVEEVSNVKIIERFGDDNIVRPQGQVLIHSNRITGSSQFGIVVDAAARDGSGNRPHIGAVRNTRELNVQSWVPSVVVENNVISFGGQGGILFSGDPNAGNIPQSAIPFGRIVNNTIFGSLVGLTGVGIQVQDFASPTVLNNIVSRLDTGVSITADSATTVLGGTLYKTNTNHTNTPAAIGLGSFELDLDLLSPLLPLFRNPAIGDFTLVEGSLAIDSSIDSLSDRPELLAVTQPLGISKSPILAPEQDLLGRLRIDNPLVASPPGLGLNVFKDRGALERLDPVTVGVDNVTVLEGNAGTVFAVFNVALSEVLSIPFNITISSSPGTALDNIDYLPTFGTLTFQPGESTKLVSMTVFGDLMDEDDETFFLNLSNPTAGAALSTFAGSATILDDDGPPSLSVFDQSVFEGDVGQVNVVLTLTLSAASGRTVTVDFNTSNGTASNLTDYIAASGTVTFTPGISTAAITMQTRGDKTVEPDETFFLNLANPVNATLATPQATITIIDDDAAVNINDVTVTEGNTGSITAIFTVSLTKPASSAVTMTFATSNGTAVAGADYTAVSGSLTFLPLETAKTVTVQILGDTLDEANETFTVNISSLVNATLSDGQGVGTIVDNDIPPTVSITPAVTIDPEGDAGSTSGFFLVTLSGVSGQQVFVQFATANGGGATGAVAPQDYTSVSGTLTFVPGVTQQSIVVPVLGDTTAEPNETFLVNLVNPTNATVAAGQGQATATIIDDEPRMSISDVLVTESDIGSQFAVFTVSLTRTSSSQITVVFATANGTALANADYTPTTGTLTFASGEFQQSITVPVLGDPLNEGNETFSVNLSNVSPAAILADNQGIGTISDNDPVPTISIADAVRNEGNAGSSAMPFIVTLSNPSGQPVTVRFATANSTATSGSDYTNTAGTLTFAAGVTQQTLNVSILGDTVVEPDELFFVNLSNASASATILDSQGQGTIIDDEANLTISDVTVTEGNGASVNAVFNLVLSKTVNGNVTVVFTTADGTANAGSDYAFNSGTLTFLPNETAKSIIVPITGDLSNESSETFFLNLSGIIGATLADNQGVATIQDDDPPPVLSINSITVTEGDSGAATTALTVSLSAPLNRVVTVNFATANLSAIAGTDYISTSGGLTFQPGESIKQIPLQILGDTQAEINETFVLTLLNPVNALISAGTGNITIADNDPTPFLVTGADYGGGPHVKVFDPFTNQERFGFFAYHPNFIGGVRVATADINNDGQVDIITVPGPGGGPHLRVFDGRTMGIITEFFAFDPAFGGGVTIATGDVNLDGRPDIIVGTEGGGGAQVKIFNGTNMAVLNTFNLSNTAFSGGVRVAAGDLNGDGRAEVIIANAPGNTPRVLAMDAQTGAAVRDFFAYDPAFPGGVYVAAGDVDGDGRADIITGPGFGGGPHVRAFSGATGASISDFFAYHPNFNGGVRVGTVDANGDGRLDIITAAGPSGGPHVKLFDAPSRNEISGFFAYHPNFNGGVFVAGSKANGPSGSPQLAAQGLIASADAPQITEDQLQPILRAAVDRWHAAGVGGVALDRLQSIDVRVADLPEGYLGMAFPSALYIDVNAAGYGWFVDSTPDVDEEFTGDPRSPATGRMDLLSTVMHELGHALGLDDLYSVEDDDEVMAGMLGTGTRRVPGLAAVDSIFAADSWD